MNGGMIGMIIRETNTEFICIDQNHHAHLAKQLISPWKADLLADDPFQDTVLYAVEQHDVGWQAFDQEPLWNDQTNKPYTFIDLPLLIKTVLYTNGVNMVEKRNPYAAALCSAHYTKFLQKYDIKELVQYVENEQQRRQTILQAYPEIDEETFDKHLSVVQFADNLSLFICLHGAGNNEERHRYFQKGVPIPEAIDSHGEKFIEAEWLNEEKIQLTGLPKVEAFSIVVEEKALSKEDIQANGLISSYEETKARPRTIQVVV